MVIYKITNKLNGKIYIGQTVRTLEKRWQYHNTQKTNTCFSRAIQKYGKDAFEVKTLTRCKTIEEMNHREEYYIKLFNTLSPNGYNLLKGGNNKMCHEETKKKMSEVHKGQKNHWFGKKHSLETIRKISRSKKGVKTGPPSKETRKKLSEGKKGALNPRFGKPGTALGRHLSTDTKIKLSVINKGKTVSKETRAKISAAFKGKPLSEEHKAKISAAHKARKQVNAQV